MNNEKKDSSFAQPNPSVEHDKIIPKTHAAKIDEEEAIKRNSKKHE